MSCYARPRLAWIKRRARRLQAAYGISRRLAVFDAWRDFIDFTTPVPHAHLVLVPGGKA